MDAREEQGLTQKELADKAGMTQADLSRLETMSANPTLRTLKKLAAGMGKTLHIVFA